MYIFPEGVEDDWPPELRRHRRKLFPSDSPELVWSPASEEGFCALLCGRAGAVSDAGVDSGCGRCWSTARCSSARCSSARCSSARSSRSGYVVSPAFVAMRWLSMVDGAIYDCKLRLDAKYVGANRLGTFPSRSTSRYTVDFSFAPVLGGGPECEGGVWAMLV